MRTNLEPIIDTLFEEDELFAQDFDQDGLNRILFIRKMGIYVEVRFYKLVTASLACVHTQATAPLHQARGLFSVEVAWVIQNGVTT